MNENEGLEIETVSKEKETRDYYHLKRENKGIKIIV